MVDTRFFDYRGPFLIGELADLVGAELLDATVRDRQIDDVASLHKATASQITFLSNAKYIDMLAGSQAGACLLEAKYSDKAPHGMAVLVCANPYLAYAIICEAFYKVPPEEWTVADSAVIDPTAEIGKDCRIESGVIIGPYVKIGDHCRIGAGSVIERGVTIGPRTHIANQVSISYSIIGSDCIIHPGVRLGQDGFGFAFDGKRHRKVPQLGRVIIGNDVEIGANSCIDRGSGGDTSIGDGCKIDNLVQIGHNVELGRGCIIVAQVGISGSTQMHDFVVAGGQAGFAGHLTIGAGAQIAAQSGVIRDIPARETFGGYPAVPVRDWHRQSAALRKLIKKS